MVRKLVTLPPHMEVFQAIRLLVKHRISGAPVVDDQLSLLGVFTEKSAMSAIMDAAYDQMPGSEVQTFMVKEVVTIEADTDLLNIIQVFRDQPTRRLQVMENGKMAGQISRRDVIYKAAEIIAPRSTKEKTVLYLSALLAQEDAPI